MIRKLLVVIISILAANHTYAQTANGSIKGALRDTTAHQVLKRATISVLKKDSSVVAEALSGDDGTFTITNIPAGIYSLKIVFNGYETRYSNFTIDSNNIAMNAGNIYIVQSSHELADVIVQTPPIIIKKDTLEYGAGSFAVKPNATAEDLLKKLPGVDVDNQGNIKAQGETVQRVLVNGKRFFGDDPRMATQNLPSDVIDKIQVFDDQSDQSAFTGFDDGNRVKTVNIITKKNSGTFGKLIAGVGDKGLYNVATNFNIFKGNQQITFIGQLNNTNKQNFTPQDILGSGGGGGRSGGSGRSAGLSGGGRSGGGIQQLQSLNANNSNTGIITTSAAGLNYRDQWGKNTSIYGSYFYNNLLTSKDQNALIQSFLTNDTLFSNQVQSSLNRIVNHRINLNIETQLDSANSFVIRPNISYQQTNNTSHAVTNTTLGKFDTTNKSTASVNSHNEGYNGNIDVLYRHKFQKKGRTFSLDINGSGNTNNGHGNNFSVTDYVANGVDSANKTINQHYILNTKAQGISTTAAYTEPLGQHSQLELDYNYNYNKNTAGKTTYDYDSATQKFTTLDSLLTNQYENTYSSNRVTINYRVQTGNLNFSLGNGVQFGNLTSINTSKNIELTQHYTNIYPTANFRYSFTRTSSLRFNYLGRTSQPNVTQLQPVIDNSDPQNVQIGNPDLKQSFTHSFRLLYNSFDNVHFRNIFATINASFVQNQISSNLTQIAKTGIDTIRYTNLNGAYNISAFFNYGFQLKKPKSNMNFTTNFTDSRGVSLVNKIFSNTQTYTLGETAKFTTNLKKNFDMNFSATPTYNIVKYTGQTNTSQNYFSQVLNTEATYYTNDGWLLEANFNYTAYTGRETGYNTSVPLLNAAFAKQFLKNKAAELRFSVFDLLNQNKSIVRTTQDNTISDVQTKVLTRYFLLQFTYNLKNFNKPQQRQMPTFFDRDGNGNNGRFNRDNNNQPPPSPPPSSGGNEHPPKE